MTPAQANTDGKPLLTLNTILLTADTQLRCGHTEQARILLEEAYTRAHLIYGPTHPVLLEILEKIADAYFTLGKYSKCSEVNKSYINILSRYFGKNHPRTLEAIERLARRPRAGANTAEGVA